MSLREPKTPGGRPAAATRRLPALFGLAALLLVVWSAPAMAHARLVESDPAPEARLSESPAEVRLRFSEPVDAEFSPLEVYDSAGDRVDVDDARVDPEDARVVLVSLPNLSQGTYEVRWRVTSADGHVVDGEYGFVVRESASEKTQESGDTGGGEVETRPAESRDSGPGLGRVAALGFVAVSLVVLLVVVLRRSRS